MFSVINLGSVDQRSTWRSSLDKSTASTCCQTNSIETKDAKNQSIKRIGVNVQTQIDTDTDTDTDTRSGHEARRHYDKPSLYAFLSRVTPLVIRELERNAKSNAFLHLQQQSKQFPIVTLAQFGQPEASSSNFAALCVATNGNELSVGYGAVQHDAWCDHRTKLAMFQCRDPLCRPKLFDMDSCVSCVSYNDRKLILTCGMYTGEILCWDSDEQIQVAGRHSARVTSLQWRPIYEGKRLLSAGIDGSIKLWKIREKKLNVSEEFVVTTWDADVKLTSRLEATVGVTCTSFSYFDDTQFSIGTEGGYVMIGSLGASRAAFGPGKKCVTMSYKRHQGHVTSTSFSPHSRNVFLTSSVDMKARVYSQLQQAPVVSFVHAEQLVKALWAPATELHIITATCNGIVNAYDIRKAYIPLSQLSLDCRISDLSFVSPEQIVAATDKGLVYLLQLPELLTLGGSDSTSIDQLIQSLEDGIGFE